ncbi:hypothetical protein acdb102_06740 [Acidothermaceae bacterium B102]|nr:hypothetical protein acdb102_06740 [Acidothermaceae bacterium B102]
MAIFFSACLVALVLVAIGRWWWLGRPGKTLQLLHKAARDLDLSVDPVNAAPVAARLVRRERAALVGHVGACLVVLPFYALYMVHVTNNSAHHFRPPSLFLLILMVPYVTPMLGRQAVLAGLLVREAHRRGAHRGPRVARAVVPHLSDYVRPLEIWAARFIALAVVPAAVLGAVFGDTDAKTSALVAPSLVVGAAIVAAVWALAELTARRLLEVGQPADNPIELAWDDALRSRQLRELFLFVSAFGLLLTMFSALGELPDSLTMVPFLCALAVLGLLGLVGKPASHYRRRLWPAPTDRRQARATA